VHTQKNGERLKKPVAPKGLTNRNQDRRIHLGVNNTFAEETLSHEKILRKIVTYEYIEKPSQRITFDRRNCLSKLPEITNYLRDFYQDEDLIPHDDVVLAIENLRGSDRRTIRKYIGLLLRHNYLVPANTKPSNREFSRKHVRIRTSSSVSSREYEVQEGFKLYRFGPKAPRSYQKKLVPPSPSPLTRSSECSSEKNMCVSRRGERDVGRHVSSYVKDGIVENKKEEEVVLHTHILNTVIDKNKAKPTLTPEERRILWSSRGNGG
jgi:hypothetical protein